MDKDGGGDSICERLIGMRHLTAISHYVWNVNVAICSPCHHIFTLGRAPQILSDGICFFFNWREPGAGEPEAREPRARRTGIKKKTFRNE